MKGAKGTPKRRSIGHVKITLSLEQVQANEIRALQHRYSKMGEALADVITEVRELQRAFNEYRQPSLPTIPGSTGRPRPDREVIP